MHNIMLYMKGEIQMQQKLSDAELEIMKIIWENPEENTLFSYLMD